MKRTDQHDLAFKTVMEDLFGRFGVSAVAGVEVAKSALKIDLVVTGASRLPEKLGLLARLTSRLPTTIVFEFKGPTDPLGEADIWRTVACAALLARQERVPLSEGIGAVLVYVGASASAKRIVDEHAQRIECGWNAMEPLRLGELDCLQVHFVDVKSLSVGLDTLPFILFENDVSRLEEAIDLVISDPFAKGLYMKSVYKMNRKRVEAILKQRGMKVTDLLTVKEMIEDFGGLEHVIEEVGLKRVIEEIGLKRVMDEVGLKRVVEELGPEYVVRELEAIALSDDPASDSVRELILELAKRIRDRK